eukprot:9481068-Pyramimonas_sp.AAC.1
MPHAAFSCRRKRRAGISGATRRRRIEGWREARGGRLKSRILHPHLCIKKATYVKHIIRHLRLPFGSVWVLAQEHP